MLELSQQQYWVKIIFCNWFCDFFSCIYLTEIQTTLWGFAWILVVEEAFIKFKKSCVILSITRFIRFTVVYDDALWNLKPLQHNSITLITWDTHGYLSFAIADIYWLPLLFYRNLAFCATVRAGSWLNVWEMRDPPFTDSDIRGIVTNAF